MKARDEHDLCWYCGMPLAVRHEHDHVVPKRHAGTGTVPICMNCHELKDRTPLVHWPADVVMRSLLEIQTGPARLLAAKLYAVALDAEARDHPMRGIGL